MARITIEDSLKQCPNVYEMIRVASLRAHQLQRGAISKIPVVKDKKGRVDAPTVIALREIAEGFTNFDNVIIPEKDPFGESVTGPSVRAWDMDRKERTTVRELPIVATDTKKEDNQ